MSNTLSLSNAGVAARLSRYSSTFNTLFGLVAVALIFELLGWIVRDQSFLLNAQRLSIMILQVSVVGIVAIGVTQVIITGGVDLSSGSTVGASAMIAMSLAQVSTNAGALYPSLTDLPVIVPVAAGLGVGLAVGLVNGIIIAYTRIPPFIATLGMMVFMRGVANWYTRGDPVSFPTSSYVAIGAGMTPVVIFLVIALMAHILLTRTLYGRRTFAIGSNFAAAGRSGIKVGKHLVLVYAIAGLLSGFAGVVLSARAQTAQAGMGVTYELDAIAMAVIGGCSLLGGRGTIFGTLIGALIFGLILSGFTFLRIDVYYQEMVKGIIVVAAVVSDTYRQKRLARRVDAGK